MEREQHIQDDCPIIGLQNRIDQVRGLDVIIAAYLYGCSASRSPL
jgi:hypothetical protein